MNRLRICVGIRVSVSRRRELSQRCGERTLGPEPALHLVHTAVRRRLGNHISRSRVLARNAEQGATAWCRSTPTSSRTSVRRGLTEKMSQRLSAAVKVSSRSLHALAGACRGTGGGHIAWWSRARMHAEATMRPYKYRPERCAQERAWQPAEEDRATCMGAVSDSGPERRERAERAHETTEQVLKQSGRVRAVAEESEPASPRR